MKKHLITEKAGMIGFLLFLWESLYDFNVLLRILGYIMKEIE